MKLAWLFPGQGTQSVGMGKNLYDASPAARRTLDAAEAALGFPLTRLLFEGPAEALLATVNTQPAIVAVSLAALAAFQEAWEAANRGPLPRPAFVAGHSVGEYAALVASGAADAATGLRLVRERARLMHEAGQAQPGSMVAVLGLTREAVDESCRQARAAVPGSYVAVANHNAETQVVIAGDAEGLTRAADLCKQVGARRCVPLSVSAAFHSAAMAPAAGPLAAAVAGAAIDDARVPLVGNVGAVPLTAAADIRRELATQVARPVLWADATRCMVDGGARVFVEFGAGQVLTNLIQRADPDLAATAVGDAAAARETVSWLGERLT
jgi:[acyl-carrier-protein] S-malonyltransferase